MFTISQIEKENLQYLEMKNANGNTKARICLNQGGRLDMLLINSNQIIADMDRLTYKDNYASSILFPFANRIKNGKYSFNDIAYSLNCNEAKKNNALHGLVYNKKFSVIEKEFSESFASVRLSFTDNANAIGFPFKYKIELIYKLDNEGVSLKVVAKNKDQKAFPFSIGWHPYFESEDLYNSFLQFECNKHLAFDEQQIPSKNIDFKETMPYQIKNNQLDDGYILDSNTINFITPKYNLKITSSHEENYLQIYTPNQQNVIAIEPMTAIPDCFNNMVGLKVLEPKQEFEIKWKLEIKNQK